MKHILLATTVSLALAASTTPAHAQWRGLLDRAVSAATGAATPAPAPSSPMPGGLVVTPDGFLAETTETTQIVMVSVAILAEASRATMEMNSLKARIDEINGCQDLGELNVMRAAFDSDMEALKANEQSSESLRAAYASGDQQRRDLLGAAAYNLLWAGLRMAILISQTDDLLAHVRSNPRLWMQAGSMLQTTRLVAQQAGALPVIYSHARIIMREEGTEEPRDAASSGARLIQL